MPSPLPSLPPSLFAHPAAEALLVEALALVGDGVPAADVESAALAAGLSHAPLAVLDAMSLEVVDHALHDELHALEHGHAHAHAKGHGGDADLGHSNDHGHRHDHGHQHDHDHPHDHDHSHAHAHDSGRSGEAGHGHAHDHGHSHAHSHDPGHSHDPAPPAKAAPTHRHAVKSRRMPESAVYVVEKMAHGYKRGGTATGGGFYDASQDPPRLWSGLKSFERRGKGLPAADIADRLTHAAVLAVLAAPSVPQAPIATVFGPRVPADAAAATALATADGFLERSRALAARFGPRFEPSPAVLERLGRA